MTVKVVKAKNYDVKSLEHLIRDAIKDLGLNLNSKNTALLKPNIVIPAKPGSAIITHPAVVEALINVLKEIGFKDIIIGEGPGVGADELKAFELSGYRKLAEKKNVKLINLNKAERIEIKWKYGTVKLPKLVLESDLYINMPKMKTHGQTAVTLSMKNQKGLLSRTDKQKFHKLGLHEPLVELAKVVQPHLIIVDAIEGMEGEGPLNGRKKKAGVLVIGTNQAETDMVCCGIMGIDYKNVKHIAQGIRQNIGQEAPDLIGIDIQEVRTNFKQANEKYGKFLNVYSWRNPYACSMCIDSFSLAVKSSIWSPKCWFSFLPKFTYYALLRHLYIIQGKHAEIPDVKGKVICLGDCTKEIADKNHLVHIEGCPPDSRNIFEAL
ncbi:MAG: DUF362 domain-containing protein [Candidatus Methanoperedens sp.]|nr:DUF362 domain-containing protein [Candidatus Methanoperedens sp.]MCZ7371837.1 DUF362 domain-containing protein [Candidatus Methanoperedens sp.]